MGADEDGRLVVAVRRGDAEQVRDLLHDGADPDTCDGNGGAPVLCLAISAYDETVAEALVEAGADPLRRLSDGSTPLLRAVDSGSLPLTRAVLPEIVRRPGPARDELLDRARLRARTTAEDELRRRTGSPDPIRRTRHVDATGSRYERLALGDSTLCDGQQAILTAVEAHLGVSASFDELLARARPYPDREHVVWCESVSVLGHRLDDGTWDAATALSRDPDPLNRLFGADVLLMTLVSDASGRHAPYLDRAAELVPWARRERDTDVLDVLLNGLTWAGGPGAEAVGLSHLAHPDPRIRGWVPDLLDTDVRPLRPESLAAVLTLLRDPDADVRHRTCHRLAHHRGPEPEIGDALLALTRDERQDTRAWAVAGLAARDDPRCLEAERHIGPVETGTVDEWLPLTAVWHYRRRMERQESEG
ncbi:ankyrin repeat domain-containing protein [Streptomyces lucensis]|nr:ankyrin repeat domain-containing protein [Streptomyces lucensis]